MCIVMRELSATTVMKCDATLQLQFDMHVNTRQEA